MIDRDSGPPEATSAALSGRPSKGRSRRPAPPAATSRDVQKAGLRRLCDRARRPRQGPGRSSGHDGGRPPVRTGSTSSFRILEVSHGPEPMRINTQHPGAESVHVRQTQQAGHQDTAKPEAVSDTARPERMTASTGCSRSLPVDRPRRGICVDSKNATAGHTPALRNTSGTWTRAPPPARQHPAGEWFR